jgi:hypothetical protein
MRSGKKKDRSNKIGWNSVWKSGVLIVLWQDMMIYLCFCTCFSGKLSSPFSCPLVVKKLSSCWCPPVFFGLIHYYSCLSGFFVFWVYSMQTSKSSHAWWVLLASSITYCSVSFHFLGLIHAKLQRVHMHGYLLATSIN